MTFGIAAMMMWICADGALAAIPAAATAVQSAPAAPVRAEPADAEAAPALALPASFKGAVAYSEASDQEVADRVVEALERVTTLEGDFTQIAPSGAVSSGKFFLRRPGLLRFEYEPPTPLLVVANGGMVFVRDEALETTDSYPVNRTPLKFLLRKKIELDDARLVGVDRGVDDLAVTFASSDEETEGQITLLLDAADLSLKQWSIRDPQEGVTVVALENVTAGGDLPNRLFRVPETQSPFLKN